MGKTMTSKLLSRAAGLPSVDIGETVLARVDVVTSEDSGTFIDAFNAEGLRVWDPRKLIFCFDHSFQPEWMPMAAFREHPKIRKFARDQGIPMENVYDFGRNGLSHQIPVEDGWALPGTVVIGLDTQSSTMGAANCFAMPSLWGTDAVLLTGDVWIQVPECVEVRLEGSLPAGVTGKDVGYHLLRDLASIASGRVIEPSGPGIASLPMDVRMAIANSAMQVGALTMVFPPDGLLLDYVGPRARTEFEPVWPDQDAEYVASRTYDLSELGPLIAGPYDIELVRELPEVAGLPVSAVNIGSCSSGTALGPEPGCTGPARADRRSLGPAHRDTDLRRDRQESRGRWHRRDAAEGRGDVHATRMRRLLQREPVPAEARRRGAVSIDLRGNPARTDGQQ